MKSVEMAAQRRRLRVDGATGCCNTTGLLPRLLASATVPTPHHGQWFIAAQNSTTVKGVNQVATSRRVRLFERLRRS